MGYLDVDWRAEPPGSIDEYLHSEDFRLYREHHNVQLTDFL
jgi:hypothetical protein